MTSNVTTVKILLNIVNLILSICFLVVGVILFIYGSFHSIIFGAYIFVFGLFFAILEIAYVPDIAKFIMFYFTFIGRGAAYFLMALLCFYSNDIFCIITAIIGMVMGILYMGMQCLKALPFPYPIAGYSVDVEVRRESV